MRPRAWHRPLRPCHRELSPIAEICRLTRPSEPTSIANLSLITAEADLAGAEIDMVGLDRREYRLRDALDGLRPADKSLQLRPDRLPAQPRPAYPQWRWSQQMRCWCHCNVSSTPWKASAVSSEPSRWSSAALIPGSPTRHRAHHVRSPQQPVEPGSRPTPEASSARRSTRP